MNFEQMTISGISPRRERPISQAAKLRERMEAQRSFEGFSAEEPPKELLDKIADCEAIMVHLCPVDERIFSRAPKLKLVLSNRFA